MPLPPATDFTGSSVTEGAFKTAITSMRTFLATLLGTLGTRTEAVTTLGLTAGDRAKGRLTLTTATPVTSADVTGATTVYFTPYNGNEVELYDGADWVVKTFSELSQTTSDSTKSPAAVA